MKPYKNIKSENLGLLLFIARATAYLGILSFFIGIIMFVMISIFTPAVGIAATFALLPLSVVTLLLSGLMAAIVSFEENYRIRTEHLISQRDC